MAQSLILATYFSVFDSLQAKAGLIISIIPPNSQIILQLNDGDTGNVTANIAFVQNGTKNYQNFTVTSAMQTVPIPSNTSGIECNVIGGNGQVSLVKIQILTNS